MTSSYKVLALKYRPQNFAAVVGQQATLLALQHALDKQQLHHAYLFTGTRGVGKTTLARLLAKSLNCEQGVSSKPCGVCEMCTSIAQGENVDVIEIDAASRTKVEDTRDLLDNVPYAAVRARYKIYIIDEVHMLSNHSFNALLKTLEEPPEHVKFILATTDPQKLPVTVLSRCLQFHLRNLTAEQIIQHLNYVLTQEQIAFEQAALPIIAQCANGSMRDALSLLEQVIAFGERNVTVQAAQQILGTAVQTQTLELLTQIIAGNANQVVAIVRELAAVNADFNQVLKILQTFIHQAALAQVVPEAIASSSESEQIKQLAQRASAQDLQLYYQAALMGVRDLPYAPDIVTGFEMIALRMLAFMPVSVQASATERTEIRLPTAGGDAEGGASPSRAATASTMGIPAAAGPAALRPSIDPAANWGQIIPQLNLQGLTKVIAENCTVAQWSAENIALTLHESQKPLLNAKNVEKIQVALQEYLKNKVKLTVTLGALNAESPAEQGQRVQQAAAQAAEQALRADVNLQKLEQTFSAKIADININET
ncbi:MAG TPA: DNA polymerase III subunit gamma/tau [Gammaproteobacteria bacterium]|nr:DNA polymerase III subunit gamma/tau [Gammaproteobacteria bacterium]